MSFQEYLTSKKIDATAFLAAEPALFAAWESEFGQMHPNSFTVQKLNMINPTRRKYLLPIQATPPAVVAGIETSKAESPVDPSPAAPASPPKVARPMFKPKPKTN